MTQLKISGGRTVALLVEKVRARIEEGEIPSGSFLPSVRSLAEEYGVAKVTVNRALQALARDGWLASQPRHGYRVRAGLDIPDRGLPIALVHFSEHQVGQGWDEFPKSLMVAFQRVSAERGWSQLTLSAEGLGAGQIVRQLSASNACGIVLNGIDTGVLKQLKALGIPTVVIDAWKKDVMTDTVLQDGFLGAMKAATWLAERGHRRVGWIGPKITGSPAQVVERFGGAVAGLASMGQSLSTKFEAPLGQPEKAYKQALRFLKRANRPTAILALWQEMTTALARAARELKLSVGKDFEMVGWSTEEDYQHGFLPNFYPDQVPPAVVWSIEEMAATAIARIKQRRAEPRLAANFIRIPTDLKFPSK